jgi:F-type H+-transporting ATPase subunit delta
MLLDQKIIRNYASSLWGQVDKLEVLEDIIHDLQAVKALIQAKENMLTFLTAPIISYEEKWSVISALFKDKKLHELSKNFLYILVKKARINLLDEIIAALQAHVRDKQGVKYVQIFSCNKLQAKEMQIIEEFLKSKLAQKIQLHNEMKQDLLGGVLIKYDNIVIDCSIAGAINKFAQIVAR